MIFFELCHWRKLCGDYCISEYVVLRSTPSRGAAVLFSYRNERYPAIQMYQFMHIPPCSVPTKKPTHHHHHYTPEHQFTEDLLAATHHFCNHGWLLGTPSLKRLEPSCSSIHSPWTHTEQEQRYQLLSSDYLKPLFGSLR